MLTTPETAEPPGAPAAAGEDDITTDEDPRRLDNNCRKKKHRKKITPSTLASPKYSQHSKREYVRWAVVGVCFDINLRDKSIDKNLYL